MWWKTFVAVALSLTLVGAARGALVSYWPMNEGSGTSLGNQVVGGPTGTLYNTEAGDWIPRAGGTAVVFDGSNEYADLSTNATLDAMNQQITLGAMVRTTHTGAWFRAIVAKFGDTAINNFWGLGWMNTNQLGFVVRDNATPRQDALATAPANWGLDGQWHSVIGVRDKAGSGKVYFFGDGQLLAEATDDVGDCSNTRPLQIARHGGGTYIPEAVDDVAVWNEALTPYAIDMMHKGWSTPQNATSLSNAIMDDNPVAYYRLEERAGLGSSLVADFSGKGHTATVYNGVGQGLGPRHLAYDTKDRYASFDGTDDYVRANAALTSAEFAGGGNYTIETWFNADTRHQGVLAVLVDAVGDSHGIFLELESDGRIRYLHRVPAGASGGTNIYTAAPYLYNTGQWYHLVAVKDGVQDLMSLYLNGVLVGTATDATDVNYNMNLVLGRISATGSARYFDGLLDEVALYNRAFTWDEVRHHYGAAFPEPGTLTLVGFGLAGLLRRRRRARAR